MLKELDHIGVVVEDLENAISMYTSLFGFSFRSRERVDAQSMEIATVELGTLKIELLHSTSDSGVLSNFLSKRGPGVHHLAYRVEDINGSLSKMKKAAIRLIDEHPRAGSDNNLIAFLHPKDTGGVLVELCEKQEQHS
jgi:methylmalonyl-CoA/ethylmalonyl-CoA epimerase